MGIKNWYQDRIRVRLISANPALLINALMDMDITLHQIAYVDDLTIEADLEYKSFKLLESVCNKRGDKIEKIARQGVYTPYRIIVSRPLLWAGIVLYVIACIIIPTRIYFIFVEGNSRLPSELIKDVAEIAGVYFGAPRSAVRSETIKNILLSEFSELRWAGINTYGCVAIISVRENTEMPQQKFNNAYIMTAKLDGIITDITLNKGNLMCKYGQAVRKGDLLVSGYTDFGTHVGVAGVDAEIYADTLREITAIMPNERQFRRKKTKNERKFSIIVGKKRIKLYNDSGIYDTGCVKIYKELPLALPGGFCLPLSIGVESCYYYQLENSRISANAVSDILLSQVKVQLQNTMIGGRIRSINPNIYVEGSTTILNAECYCNEIIGQYNR